MNDITLKEVLLQVSHKLDRFLEAHSALHTEMARNESKVDSILAHQQQWGPKIEKLEEWQDEVQGQMKLIKWASGGGLVAVGALVLKLMGVPLP